MADTILIIRHAEKPQQNGDSGIDETGAPDPKSLTPRGWQRAGAWAQLFVPALGQQPVLPTPTALFASNPNHENAATAESAGGKSRRPLETITPLAGKLSLGVATQVSKQKVGDLVAALATTPGVVLVCWQHEVIVEIANAISHASTTIPTKWPGSRFNVIFRLDRPSDGSPWKFQQVVPVLLAGDLSTPI
jgi:hypothetical protein